LEKRQNRERLVNLFGFNFDPVRILSHSFSFSFARFNKAKILKLVLHMQKFAISRSSRKTKEENKLQEKLPFSSSSEYKVPTNSVFVKPKSANSLQHDQNRHKKKKQEKWDNVVGAKRIIPSFRELAFEWES
jgi:hypothetical protein